MALSLFLIILRQLFTNSVLNGYYFEKYLFLNHYCLNNYGYEKTNYCTDMHGKPRNSDGMLRRKRK